MSEPIQIVVGLAGNPNAGKTSLFNKLTGMRAHVGNYPGVTVEKKWGQLQHKGYSIKIVDLPGTYSLNSFSLDEQVARHFIIHESPHLIVNVVDTTNLERNLYLTLQFLEMGLPTVLALNMMDLSEAQGIKIDIAQLKASLGVEAAPVVATSGKGLNDLLDEIVDVYEKKSANEWKPIEISYGQDIDEVIARLQPMVEKSALPTARMPARWLTLKYLEGDLSVTNLVEKESPHLSSALKEQREKLAQHIKTTVDDELEGVMTDQRYGFLTGLQRTAISHTRKDTRRLSDSIDKILLNRLLAPFIFIAIIYGLYVFTFWASEPVVGWLEAFFGWLGGTVESGMPEGLLKDLILEGIINGVGGVLGFAPLITFMFIGIAILEDSGYMARVAFILDRIFRAFGMHGNSVVALIVSGGIAGGCAIPGVMATRTLRDPKERIATVLVTPFMTCGAKLPVFLMLVGAFFSDHKAAVMMGLTLFAWAIALVSAKILRMFILPGKPAPFVLELPPYRMPTLRGVLLHAWERTWSYIKKAGTVIVGVTIVIWLMMTFPGLSENQQKVFDNRIAQVEAQLEAVADGAQKKALLQEKNKIKGEADAAGLRNSAAGRLGTTLEPLSKLIGLDWRTNIALMGGFAAKEVVLSTLGTAYAIAGAEAAEETETIAEPGSENAATAQAEEEEEDEEEVLSRALGAQLVADPNWTPLSALSLMLFVLIYAPCFVTIAVIGKEIGMKWAAFSLVGSTVYAYILCLILYQGGRALGIGI